MHLCRATTAARPAAPNRARAVKAHCAALEKFIILRDAAVARRGRGLNLGMKMPGPSLAAAAPAEMLPQPTVHLVELSPKDVNDCSRDPIVRFVTRPLPITLITPVEIEAATSQDPQPQVAWGITAVGADASKYDGKGVSVCVLDTGCDVNHPAFNGVNFVKKDFTGSATGTNDVHGHGTHCMGTVLGRDVNGMRIGVARGVEDAFVGKVLGDNGGGTSTALFEGMLWARGQGAQVVSMSLGFDMAGAVAKMVQEQNYPVQFAAMLALNDYRIHYDMFRSIMELNEASISFGGGSVVVAATGNESHHPKYVMGASLPAATRGIVAVGALGQGTGPNYAVAWFSNSQPTVSAPGVNILSAGANTQGLVALSGTSMATPHVAGVAALWWQAQLAKNHGVADSSGVTSALRNSCTTTGLAASDDVVERGDGLVQAPK